MGLDMYLNRMPRYKNITAEQVRGIEYYFDWIREKEKGSEYSSCTFEEWCNRSLSSLPDVETIEHFRQFYRATYSNWDTKKEYPWYRIDEEVGYWRKANHIHNWFVDNIQNGEDDCRYHREVTKEDLEELLDLCHEVLCNPDLAEQRLPTCSGFFFGDTSYDEYYMQDIKDTIDIITTVLETTDFETQMIYYVSSW